MKIWLPCTDPVGGIRAYTETLADGLGELGHDPVPTPFPVSWQLSPRRLRGLRAPAGVDVVVADSWIAHAFRSPSWKLVSCEHHTVHDPAYRRCKSWLRRLAHETWLRSREESGFRAAAAVVAVSAYTAHSLCRAFPGIAPEVIPNPVDTEFFTPAGGCARPRTAAPVRLFFAGDLVKRKGADLLARIMRTLGPRYHLRYAGGGRAEVAVPGSGNLEPLGCLSRARMREEYRAADIFLFPSRFESFGIAAAEAMACETPVVASRTAALPELIADRETGRLCPVDDVDAFVRAVRELAEDDGERKRMGERARKAVVGTCDVRRVAATYEALLARVTGARAVGRAGAGGHQERAQVPARETRTATHAAG